MTVMAFYLPSTLNSEIIVWNLMYVRKSYQLNTERQKFIVTFIEAQ